jgi:hypothetical protein
MILHLVYLPLVILVLLWLYIMLPYFSPSPPGGAPKTPTQPVQPKRKRSPEPKAFAGLTQKPPCVWCEQQNKETAPVPPRWPDPMPPTHRRPRTVDTSMHFCPHLGCDYRGWLELNNLRANGHPNGGPWRQFQCISCDGYFPEHHGTIFHGKPAAGERIVHPGHGAARRPPRHPGAGARLCAILCDRRLSRVSDGLVDALWAVSAA